MSSETRDVSPMGCVPREEGATLTSTPLSAGGQICQHGAFAYLTVLRVGLLPVLLLDPLRKQPVHEGSHYRRAFSSVATAEYALLLPELDDLGVEAVADLVKRGAHVGEAVVAGRVAQEVEEDEVEPAVRLRAHEDGVDHRRDLLLRGGRLGDRLADASGDAGEHPAHGEEDQVLLGLEVVREDGLADPGLVRHVLQGEVAQPLLAHDLVGAAYQTRLLGRQ